MSIVRVFARQIYDARGIPTVEVDLTTDKGVFRATVPSGGSVEVYEAFELRDNDPNVHHGKGVLKAISNINDRIAPALIARNFDVTNQAEIDKFMIELDGTEDKSNLGVNSILGVSIAVTKAGAAHKGLPLYKYISQLVGIEKVVLPVPALNLINGGIRSGNKASMQEFMILPVGAKTFREAMQMGSEIYHHLKSEIKERYGFDATTVKDDGGFAPDIQDNREGLDLLNIAIAKAGYTGKISIGVEVSASEFFKKGKYDLDVKNPNSDPSKWLTSDELADFYRSLITEYPIVSLENLFDQDDWDGWIKFNGSTSVQLVGDDLTITNPKRTRTAIERKACNCLLLKMNQIGTVTESLEAAKLSRQNGWGIIVCYRSGDTEDTFIADLAIGLAAGQIKNGAPCRSERLAKYNHILRIEEELGSEAVYAGENFHNPQI